MKKSKNPWNTKSSDQDRRAGISTGMGDYYGTGIKNPMGKVRDIDTPGMIPVTPKQLKEPPKSIA